MADTITLEFLAARVGVLTDEMHDLKLRFGMMGACPAALETRFSAFENRFAGQEERMARMLAILVPLAQAQNLPTQE
jgi:hypothetical protein